MKLLPDLSNLAAVLDDSRLYSLGQGGSSADMRGADLRWADLRWACLTRANLNWQSHALIGEVLRQEAGKNLARRRIAGLVANSINLYWSDFLKLRLKEKRWALTTLAKYIQPEDDHPAVLDKYRKEA